MKVLILQGGYNEEHKVSLNTAKHIGKALKKLKIDQEKQKNREKFAQYFLEDAITTNQAQKLKQQIARDGQRVPVVALADGVVLDGNSRLAEKTMRGDDSILVYFLPKCQLAPIAMLQLDFFVIPIHD